MSFGGRLMKRSAARKFYAQRNRKHLLGVSNIWPTSTVYLTGATLFLSLLLSRVFYIILDFIHVQESYQTLQQKTARASGEKGEATELRKRIAELESEQRDFGASSTPSSGATDSFRHSQEAGEAAGRGVRPPCGRAQQDGECPWPQSGIGDLLTLRRPARSLTRRRIREVRSGGLG